MSDFWSSSLPREFDSEASVEMKLIEPMLIALGYGPYDIAPKVPINFQTGKRGRKHAADFIVYAGPVQNENTSLIVVEAKAPNEDLGPARVQAESYAFATRAPFLLLTNGVSLEIWQLQPAMQSQLILQIPVSSIIESRSKIEQLIGKGAAISYSKTLVHKRVSEINNDYSSYTSAELKRLERWSMATARTVVTEIGKQLFSSEAILSKSTNGFLILATSGYGKTVLSYCLHRDAILERYKVTDAPLSFHFGASDTTETEDIADFLANRLQAHCPAVTKSILQSILRDRGIILICDGFDAASDELRNHLEKSFRNLLRDYPKIKLFVFSKISYRPQLSLEIVYMAPLSEEQKRDIARAHLRDDAISFLSDVPGMLRSLTNHPLILVETLKYWEEFRKFPRRIEMIFQCWADRYLRADDADESQIIEREELLSSISVEIARDKLTRIQALRLVNNLGYEERTFDYLVNTGVIRFNQEFVQLEHEALRDYLRAKKLAAKDMNVVSAEIATENFAADSWYPVLLLALLKTPRSRKILWQRLSQLDVVTYLDALHYRPDLVEENAQADILEPVLLTEILDGVNESIEGLFSPLKSELKAAIVGTTDGALTISGSVALKPLRVSYHLNSDRTSIAEGNPQQHFYRTLGTGYSLDIGRIDGVKTVSEIVMALIKARHLRGGVFWLRERSLGRLRYLQREYQFPIESTTSIRELIDILSLAKDRAVLSNPFRTTPQFPIRELIKDLNDLMEAGDHDLEPWWKSVRGTDISLGNDDDSCVARVLDEYYRRAQLVYRDVVLGSFHNICTSLSFYSVLPVRWSITLFRKPESHPPYRRAILYYSWLPVKSWDDAGADIRFSESSQELPDAHAQYQQTLHILADLHRPSRDLVVTTGGGIAPNFDGHHFLGGFDGETASLRSACEYLEDDIDRILDRLPNTD